MLLSGLFPSCREWGLLSSFGVRASHWRGFSRCRAQARRARGLQSLQLLGCSEVAVRRLSCSVASGIFPTQGWNPCLLHWQEGSFTTDPPGKPYLGTVLYIFLFFIRPLVSPYLFTLLSLKHSGTVISTLNATVSKMYLS